MEILKDLPRPFVLRLRDIRQKQLETRKQAEEQQMLSNNRLNNNSGGNNNMNPGNILPGLSEEALQEFMES